MWDFFKKMSLSGSKIELKTTYQFLVQFQNALVSWVPKMPGGERVRLKTNLRIDQVHFNVCVQGYAYVSRY